VLSTNLGTISIKTVRDYENGILTLNLGSPVAAGTRVTLEIGYLGFIFRKPDVMTQGVSVYETCNLKINETT
jgi:hypothetical protein